MRLFKQLPHFAEDQHCHMPKWAHGAETVATYVSATWGGGHNVALRLCPRPSPLGRCAPDLDQRFVPKGARATTGKTNHAARRLALPCRATSLRRETARTARRGLRTERAPKLRWRGLAVPGVEEGGTGRRSLLTALRSLLGSKTTPTSGVGRGPAPAKRAGRSSPSRCPLPLGVRIWVAGSETRRPSPNGSGRTCWPGSVSQGVVLIGTRCHRLQHIGAAVCTRGRPERQLHTPPLVDTAMLTRAWSVFGADVCGWDLEAPIVGSPPSGKSWAAPVGGAPEASAATDTSF